MMVLAVIFCALLYQVTAAEEVLHGRTVYLRACSEGKLVVPPVDTRLPSNFTMQWILRAPRGKQIRLFFRELELRMIGHGGCKDALAMKNGYPPFEESSQVICGAWDNTEVLGEYRMTLRIHIGSGSIIPRDIGMRVEYSCVDRKDQNATKPCPNMFPCSASVKDYLRWTECQPQDAKCDGIDQCPNGEDERNCPSNAIFDPLSGGLSSECPSKTLFKCAPHSCIPRKWVCDGRKDCDNGSDEDSSKCRRREKAKNTDIPTTASPSTTGPKRCSKKRFLCPKEGVCIRKKFVCDGVKDCDDGEDEKNCEKPKTTPRTVSTTVPTPNPKRCSKKRFLCPKEGVCIRKKFVCDGVKDCEDGEDEKNCDKPKTTPRTVSTTAPKLSCRKNEFFCKDEAVCIDKRFVCDNFDDCSSGEDERNCKKGKSSTTKKAKSTENCGRKKFPPKGHSWYWNLVIEQKEQKLCSAVLIEDTIAVTAAHCAKRCQAKDGECEVLLASRLRKHPRAVRVTKSALHPDYDESGSRNDVAVLKLEEPLGRRARPLCMDYEGLDKTNCYIAGFGSARKNRLRHAEVSLLPPATCSRSSKHGKELLDGQYCASYSTQKLDACDSESGSPVACFDKKRSQWFLAGIAVREVRCNNARKFSVFQSFERYKDWITKTAKTI